MATAKELREQAASAAMAGASADPLAKMIEGEAEAEAAMAEPSLDAMPMDMPMPPEMEAGMGESWEDGGFMFELIEGPQGRMIKMTPSGGQGEAVMVTDPQEIEMILAKKEGSDGGLQQEIPQ